MNKPMNKPMKKRLASLRRLLALPLLAVAVATGSLQANPPQLMSYQGYLTDGSGNPLGSTNTGPKNYNLIFRIWNLQTGGVVGSANELHAEQQTVTVTSGYFSVLLGLGPQYQGEPYSTAIATLFSPSLTTPLYVEMTVVGIGPAGANVTILPRLQLVSSPYAFLAANAVNAANLVNAGKTNVLSIVNNSLSIPNAGSSLTVNGTLNAGSATITNTLSANTLNAVSANVTNTLTASILVAANLTLTGSANITNLTVLNANIANLSVTRTASVISNLNVFGTNSAAYFIGNGGGITNVPTLDEPNLKMIRGRVDTRGVDTILAGNGFTITPAGGGFVTVTFTVPFSDVPIVVAQNDIQGGDYRAILSGSVTRTNFTMGVARNYANTADVDSTASFIAIGPR
jgi:hypothetical protein